MKALPALVLIVCVSGPLPAFAQVSTNVQTAATPTRTPGACAVYVTDEGDVKLVSADRTSGLFVLGTDGGVAGPFAAGVMDGVALSVPPRPDAGGRTFGFAANATTGTIERFEVDAGALVVASPFLVGSPGALGFTGNGEGGTLVVAGASDLRTLDFGVDAGVLTLATGATLRLTGSIGALYVHGPSGVVLAAADDRIVALALDGGQVLSTIDAGSPILGMAGMVLDDGRVLVVYSVVGDWTLGSLVGSPAALQPLAPFTVEFAAIDGGATSLDLPADLALQPRPGNRFPNGVLAIRDSFAANYKLVSLAALAAATGQPAFAHGVAELLPAPDAGVIDGGSSDAGLLDGGATDAGPRDGGLSDGGASDAGATDGGTPDAGPSDAGAADAGRGGSTTGGGTTGGGQVGEPDTGFNRCGCTSGGLVPLLALLSLWRRKKERR